MSYLQLDSRYTAMQIARMIVDNQVEAPDKVKIAAYKLITAHAEMKVLTGRE